MAKGAAQFKLQLDEFVDEEVMGTALKLQRDIMMDLLGKLIMNTPVGLRQRWENNIKRQAKGLPLVPKGYVGGHARKNWQVTINRPAVQELTGQDKSGRETQQRGLQQIASINKPVIGYITNLVPYIERLEQGWSKKVKPNGFVKQALQQVRIDYEMTG